MAKKNLKAALNRHLAARSQELREKKKLEHRKTVEKSKATKRAKTNRPHLQNTGWLPFLHNSLVILIGEADFGFTVSCLNENYMDEVIPTNYDSKDTILSKYPSSAQANIDYLESDPRVCTLMYDVDATALCKHKRLRTLVENAQGKTIDFVFNFPHLGKSISDNDRNIRAHQELMLKFLQQTRQLCANSRVLITLFEGEPYASWEIKRLARECGLKLERSSAFNWDQFPGYSHCLTAKEGNTAKKQKDRKARIYLFVPAGAQGQLTR